MQKKLFRNLSLIMIIVGLSSVKLIAGPAVTSLEECTAQINASASASGSWAENCASDWTVTTTHHTYADVGLKGIVKITWCTLNAMCSSTPNGPQKATSIELFGWYTYNGKIENYNEGCCSPLRMQLSNGELECHHVNHKYFNICTW